MEKSSPVVANGNYIPHLKNFQKGVKKQQIVRKQTLYCPVSNVLEGGVGETFS